MELVVESVVEPTTKSVVELVGEHVEEDIMVHSLVVAFVAQVTT